MSTFIDCPSYHGLSQSDGYTGYWATCYLGQVFAPTGCESGYTYCPKDNGEFYCTTLNCVD
ncbi:MAG: hypothetical protein IJ660_01700 [Alphaproteobacteria bacterium]|nr:hypothetical protein [Alphaproteobacteria bacterium]